MKVLLLEDNEFIAVSLKYSLENNGYEVIYAASIQHGMEVARLHHIDMAVLDVMLPDGSGFEFYEQYIRKYDIPAIFLTAKDEEDYVIYGLKLGAEDYMTKPFSTKELLVRIEKILLRHRKNTIIKVQDISFDMDKMIVMRNGEEIVFTSLELKILQLLFLNIDKVVTRDDIIYNIWRWTGNDVYDNTVTVYVKRIRSKLVTDIIGTIKGIGYRIDSGGKNEKQS